jgi:uncharacterized protein YegL
VLFVLGIPIWLGLSILALDAGQLYLSRSRLDKASRAASATALNMMALRGWGAMVAKPDDTGNDPLGFKTAEFVTSKQLVDNSVNQAVLKQMRIAAAETLQAYFPEDFTTHSEGGLASTYLKFSSGEEITDSPKLASLDMEKSAVMMQLHYQVPTLLLGHLKHILGFQTSGCVQEESSGKYRCRVSSAFSRNSGYLKPANIFLLLDTSGSMGVDSGNGKLKIDVLRQATSSFIDMFNPLKDRIAVIDFGTTVKTSTPLAQFDQTSGDHLAIKTSLNALSAAGQTNPCDALIEAAEQVKNLDTNEAKFVLLFTDGAPNVYRLDFPDAADRERLEEAMTAGSVALTDRNKGWYGWTVKWGERELAGCTPCDAANPDCRPNFDCTGPSCRSCDPVYGLPLIRNAQGKDIDSATIQTRLRLNADGRFVWVPSAGGDGVPLEQVSAADGGPYQLVWKHKASKHLDNYKWYGPSYLVHASQKIPAGASLIDRIPRDMMENPVTCGPGSRGSMPGSIHGGLPDMYNHSLYFASRVVNRNWRLGSDGRGARQLFNLNRFRTSVGNDIEWPSYFGVQQWLRDIEDQDTGCLQTLNAALPGMTGERIYVGRDDASTSGNMSPAIVSNVRPSSLKTVGEVVKTAELPYYCAIRAADYLRRSGNVTVFVVGLGPSGTTKYGAECNDPMQNALDFDSRKDNFLRRLAFSPEALNDPVSFMNGQSSTWAPSANFGYVSPDDQENLRIKSCQEHPLNNEEMTRGYSEQQVGGSPMTNSPAPTNFEPNHLGAYYGSNDPSQLKGMFGKVAKQMLLRLST